MKSYLFEFYAEYFGESVHCFMLHSDISEEQIQEFFERLLQIRRPNFEEVLKDFLKTRKIEYSDFMYIKKDFSYADVDKRTSDIMFEFLKHSNYDYRYVLYQNLGKWKNNCSWQISFVAKKVEDRFKVICQTDNFDNHKNFGEFSIKEDEHTIFYKKHSSDMENDKPVIHCDSDWLFNLLLHIDEIKNDINIKQFLRN